MITERIREILRYYGFEIVCESPLELIHKQSGDKANGVAADFVIEALVIKKYESEERERRLDAFGRL
jgi:hypothetical protein